MNKLGFLMTIENEQAQEESPSAHRSASAETLPVSFEVFPGVLR
jgi:hypothetical protein